MNAAASPAARDPRVDAYIARSAEFARPILAYLRDVVHASCPRATETIKWGFPHFMYEGMLCSMAAFKRQCAFGFWKGTLIVEDAGRDDAGMGQFGRIVTIDDLPPRRRLVSLVKAAMQLNENGTRVARRPPKQAQPTRVATPRWFSTALEWLADGKDLNWKYRRSR